MAKQIQLRRGTTAENNGFTGANGELTYDTEKKQLRVHDGSTVGGKVVDDTTRDVTNQVSNATETVAGKAKIATTAMAQAGVNDTDFITALKLKNVSFGMGQTWQNVKSSRVVDTTYTNTTSRPIVVNVTANSYQAVTQITAIVQGINFIIGADSAPYETLAAGSFVVPSGVSYSVSVAGGSLQTWHEFR